MARPHKFASTVLGVFPDGATASTLSAAFSARTPGGGSGVSTPPVNARPIRFTSLFRVGLEPPGERGGAAAVARDDEHGVVAGNRADRLVQLRAVECLGQRLRLAASGAQDDE